MFEYQAQLSFALNHFLAASSLFNLDLLHQDLNTLWNSLQNPASQGHPYQAA